MKTTKAERQIRLYFSILLIPFITVLWVQNAKGSDKPLKERALWRLEIDNDFIGNSDDMFSAGTSIQRHSPARTSWDELKLWRFGRWITDIVPGLDDREGMWVKNGIGISQLMQTPEDIEVYTLIEDDVPYAGVLTLANSWYVVNDERMAGFQILVGVVGPASMGEQVQKFVHNDMGVGDDPKGWNNQLDNEPLLNLNYIYAQKLSRWGDSDSFRADLSASFSLGAGNMFTVGDLGLQVRCGRGLPRGFVHLPDIAGRGIIAAPSPDTPSERLSFYFSLTGRVTGLAYTVLFDGNTFEDSHSVDYDHYMVQAIIGVHCARGPFSMHISCYLSSNPADVSTDSDLSWANLSLEYRF